MTTYRQDPQSQVWLPEPGERFYCVPATWVIVQNFYTRTDHTGWLLIKERVTRISGNSGWTTQDPNTGPEVMAYRKTGERTWHKGRPEGRSLHIRTTLREDIEESEAVAILLMAQR